MRKDEKLSESIRELYAIVNRLETDYSQHNRHFTLDGHLLGSIGEVYAAERYGCLLRACPMMIPRVADTHSTRCR